MFMIASGGTAFVTPQTAYWLPYILWGIGGMAVGLLASAGTAVAIRFFVKHRATVIGFNSGAVPAGMFVFVPIILAILEAYGWRAACLTTASFGVPMFLFISVYMTDYPADWGLTPYGSESMVEAPPRKHGSLFALATAYVKNTFVEPAQTGLFWTLTLGFCACGYTSFGLVSVRDVASNARPSHRAVSAHCRSTSLRLLTSRVPPDVNVDVHDSHCRRARHASHVGESDLLSAWYL